MDWASDGRTRGETTEDWRGRAGEGAAEDERDDGARGCLAGERVTVVLVLGGELIGVGKGDGDAAASRDVDGSSAGTEGWAGATVSASGSEGGGGGEGRDGASTGAAASGSTGVGSTVGASESTDGAKGGEPARAVESSRPLPGGCEGSRGVGGMISTVVGGSDCASTTWPASVCSSTASCLTDSRDGSPASAGRSRTSPPAGEPDVEDGGPPLSMFSSPAGGSSDSFFGRCCGECSPSNAPVEEDDRAGETDVDDGADRLPPPTLAPSRRSRSWLTLRSVTGRLALPGGRSVVDVGGDEASAASFLQSLSPRPGGRPLDRLPPSSSLPAPPSSDARAADHGPELTRAWTLADRSSTRRRSSRSRDVRSDGDAAGCWNLARSAATPPEGEEEEAAEEAAGRPAMEEGVGEGLLVGCWSADGLRAEGTGRACQSRAAERGAARCEETNMRSLLEGSEKRW